MQAQRGTVLRSRRAKLVLLALGVTALDQITKVAIVAWLPVGASHPIVDHILWFTHLRNNGAAFSTLRGLSGWLALAALIGVIGFLGVVVRDPGRWTGVGASLVAGGALGNLLDRLLRGGPINGTVVDFIDFHFWPAFNVADSAITIGAIVIVVASFFEQRRTGAEAQTDDAARRP
jgi:signal peptidase II